MDAETQDETPSDAASTILPAPWSEIPNLWWLWPTKAIARLNRKRFAQLWLLFAIA